MSKTVEKTSFKPVEVTTEHQWSFHNWSSLYSYYAGVKSPKISMNGVDGTCQISVQSALNEGSYLNMEFSNITDFLVIRTTTSILDSQGKQLWADKSLTSSYPARITQYIPPMYDTKSMEKYLQNDTLTVHVKFTILQAVTFSSNDVYSVNFAKIVHENSGAFRKFKYSGPLTFFIEGKELFIDELIPADKTKAFEYIFSSAETNRAKESSYSSNDTKIKTFGEFCDYLHVKTMTTSKESNKLDNKVRDSWCNYINGRVLQSTVKPANIVAYLCVIYELLCQVFKAQALHFMKVSGKKFAIPKSWELFAKYLAFVENNSKK